MFRARDKSKMHYKEWISKILENMSLYFEVLEPRLFSDNKLNKVLPVEDQCFEYIFDTKESGDRESLAKFTMKNMRSQTQDYLQVFRKIEVLFELLQVTLNN
jgi:hypothetical protein